MNEHRTFTITERAKQAIQQRDATPGQPSDGPYPATVNEVADELAHFIDELDRDTAHSLIDAVMVRLSVLRTNRVVCPTCSRAVAINTAGLMAGHNTTKDRNAERCAGTGLRVDQARPGMTFHESETIRYAKYRP